MTVQTNRVSLSDLPEEAVEKLKHLQHEDFQLLGIEAYRMRGEEEEAAFPKDAKAALKDIRKAMNASPKIEVDEPLEEIVWAFDMLCVALGRGEDLDRQDCQAFWSVATKARRLAMDCRERDQEIRLRLRKLEEAMR